MREISFSLRKNENGQAMKTLLDHKEEEMIIKKERVILRYMAQRIGLQIEGHLISWVVALDSP